MTRKEIIAHIRATMKFQTANNGLITMTFILPANALMVTESGCYIEDEETYPWNFFEYLEEADEEVSEAMIEEGYHYQYKELCRPEYDWYEPDPRHYHLVPEKIEISYLSYRLDQVMVRVKFWYEEKSISRGPIINIGGLV